MATTSGTESGGGAGARTDSAVFSPVPHTERVAVLSELHARPFEAVTSPCRAIRFAFLTDAAQMSANAEALTRFCASHQLTGLSATAKHRRIAFPDAILRWEQHSEFTTYTWLLENGAAGNGTALPTIVASTMTEIGQPGAHLVSIDLQVSSGSAPDLAQLFDPSSLAASEVLDGHATVATDFQVNAGGFVRFLVHNHGLTPVETGGLVLRILEIETYRCFALLGLPQAHRITPVIRNAEDRLTHIMTVMTNGGSGLETNRELLDEITSLAARIEADAAIAGYRFAASAAYDDIVRQRLEVIGEKAFGGWPTLAEFLGRRLNPAMRTCQTLNTRMHDLNKKLTRAANLLRTRIDVEIEQQNRDLLSAMSERARMQLRLQQTVEGLSVAAISYYVASLLHYVFESMAHYWPIDATVATGVSIPFVVIALAILLWRVKRSHGHA
ncbi:hypothetical protein ASC80_00265 [Afipia sp. Root123D2]|uniref:DUF3422 domain-containing protein n=1 Tax=Afipia sp. Root123D2 TaxID=1736436 RepID=UPI0006F7404F|nr:DUF3422 domain-containing protein [Afipia sp. Root123D2]KQW21886.1 hypothetical protein ASC80_00265 [Afipia sp. Root123D2]